LLANKLILKPLGDAVPWNAGAPALGALPGSGFFLENRELGRVFSFLADRFATYPVLQLRLVLNFIKHSNNFCGYDY